MNNPYKVNRVHYYGKETRLLGATPEVMIHRDQVRRVMFADFGVRDEFYCNDKTKNRLLTAKMTREAHHRYFKDNCHVLFKESYTMPHWPGGPFPHGRLNFINNILAHITPQEPVRSHEEFFHDMYSIGVYLHTRTTPYNMLGPASLRGYSAGGAIKNSPYPLALFVTPDSVHVIIQGCFFHIFQIRTSVRLIDQSKFALDAHGIFNWFSEACKIAHCEENIIISESQGEYGYLSDYLDDLYLAQKGYSGALATDALAATKKIQDSFGKNTALATSRYSVVQHYQEYCVWERSSTLPS